MQILISLAVEIPFYIFLAPAVLGSSTPPLQSLCHCNGCAQDDFCLWAILAGVLV